MLGMDELARHVFSYLGTGDCMAVGASCQRFKRIIRGEVRAVALPFQCNGALEARILSYVLST